MVLAFHTSALWVLIPSSHHAHASHCVQGINATNINATTVQTETQAFFSNQTLVNATRDFFTNEVCLGVVCVCVHAYACACLCVVRCALLCASACLRGNKGHTGSWEYTSTPAPHLMWPGFLLTTSQGLKGEALPKHCQMSAGSSLLHKPL